MFEGRGLGCVSGGEEKDSNCDIFLIFNIMPEFFRNFDKKRVGDLGEHSRSVTGLHIRIDRTTVGHTANGGERVIEDFITAFSMEVGDSPHAAVIVFL